MVLFRSHANQCIVLSRLVRHLRTLFAILDIAASCTMLAFGSPTSVHRSLEIGLEQPTNATTKLEPVGMYAVRPTFSDGHNSGIFSWDYLNKLCIEKERLWDEYLARLDKAEAKRD